jgi:hypothetical protein
MLSYRFTNSNLPTAIDRGAAAYEQVQNLRPYIGRLDRQKFLN